MIPLPITADSVCQLTIITTKIEGKYTDNVGNSQVIPEEPFFFRRTIAEWYVDRCLSTDISEGKDAGNKLLVPVNNDRYPVKKRERYVPITVMRESQAEAQRFFDTAKTNHTELKFEDVIITHTTFICAAKLGNNQSVVNEHLHDLSIGDMDKFSKIRVDTNLNFSLEKNPDFHKSPADTRRKIVPIKR